MTNNEQHERNKTARETLGKFFYDLAKVIFTAMVVGSIVALFASDGNVWATIGMLIVGIVSTYLCAFVGNYILKH